MCPVTTYAAVELKTALHDESVSRAGADFCLANKRRAQHSCSHKGVDGDWWLASSLLARLEQRTKTELKTYSHTQSLSEPELILDQPLRKHFELRKITEPHTHIRMERYYRQR